MSGGRSSSSMARYAIRLAKHGCTNRPFLHIQVMPHRAQICDPPLEQLGVYDPMPNENNEKLVTLNFERIRYWLGQNVTVTDPAAELLGLCGFLPIHPRTYMRAWKNRRKLQEAAAAAEPDGSDSVAK